MKCILCKIKFFIGKSFGILITILSVDMLCKLIELTYGDSPYIHLIILILFTVAYWKVVYRMSLQEWF